MPYDNNMSLVSLMAERAGQDPGDRRLVNPLAGSLDPAEEEKFVVELKKKRRTAMLKQMLKDSGMDPDTLRMMKIKREVS